MSQLTAAVMTMGEMKFKQKGRDEQCEPDRHDNFRKVNKKRIQIYSLFQVAELTEVDVNDLMTAFVKPRIKVSTLMS